MRGEITTMRSVWASIAAALCILMLPMVVLILHPQGADGRGAPLLPVLFVVVVFLCFAVSKFLLDRGYYSLVRFTVGAVVLSCGLAIAFSAPSLLIGTTVGLFSLKDALTSEIVFILLLGAVVIPSAALWWVIAGRARYKASNPITYQGAGSA